MANPYDPVEMQRTAPPAKKKVIRGLGISGPLIYRHGAVNGRKEAL